MIPDEPEPGPDEPTPEPRPEETAPQPESPPAEASAEPPAVEPQPAEPEPPAVEAPPPPEPDLPAAEAAPPPEPEPPPQIDISPPHESAPPEPEPDDAYEPAYEPEQAEPVYDEHPAQDEHARDDYALFGEPEIPMPRHESRGDRQRARDARRNLDLDLGRIKRRKRYGLFITTISVLFVAFVLAPVTWTAAYRFFDPPSNVLMMQRAAEGQTIRHYPVPINRISPHVVRAVIAAEDANFCTHDGFDVEAIQDAMESNARGRRTRGASTVSQQTAKNLFLWPERSWVRKGLETYFTSLIELMWPKRRIMEAYLNTAEWGDGNFGIEAAARARFGVSAADLTPLQAARLAAVLPSPNRWRADSPGPYVRRRAASIVERARVVRNERTASCVLIMDRPS